RAKFVQADLQEYVRSGQAEQFDVILTNPPYVDPTGEVPAELRYEPAQALFAQDHGLALIYQILELAPKMLKNGGQLIIEFGQGQEVEVEKRLKQLAVTNYTFGTDQFGITRW